MFGLSAILYYQTPDKPVWLLAAMVGIASHVTGDIYYRVHEYLEQKESGNAED